MTFMNSVKEWQMDIKKNAKKVAVCMCIGVMAGGILYHTETDADTKADRLQKNLQSYEITVSGEDLNYLMSEMDSSKVKIATAGKAGSPNDLLRDIVEEYPEYTDLVYTYYNDK